MVQEDAFIGGAGILLHGRSHAGIVGQNFRVPGPIGGQQAYWRDTPGWVIPDNDPSFAQRKYHYTEILTEILLIFFLTNNKFTFLLMNSI